LNVESGLNDGLATPVVLLGLAMASGEAGETGALAVVLEIIVGVAVGVLVGLGGGRLLNLAGARGWTTHRMQGIGMLALPVIAYTGAVLVEGNGFIAAFVAGIAFGRVAAPVAREKQTEVVVESVTDLLGFAVWFLFGAIVGPVIADIPGWQGVLFALLALTVLRMGPVALALVGTRLRLPTVAFIGWFGPRGLASLIFALLSVEELGTDEGSLFQDHREVLAVIGLTVVLSVVAHGLTGGPLANRYGRWFERVQPPVEGGTA